ncbi:serine/threonine protein phosphatase PrpC [Mucilaginibacter oryzae]|uniref:Serine/threonine protein phosphatase PrpC n=1 Tax=Mucilaginibacter oryzae TaxID=468058 RepID=A0A316H177_9SPHI|nr:protein phosphatase 2C domain-containing protein [Mucilaginibacter oryzae]PWK72519.1 serine/threonine protein phosphatase PrpC [Mucilaginibacter oryzae]
MNTPLKYVSNSKKGLKRERNQDKILIVDKDQYYLFFVFDGVSSFSTSHIFINQYTKKLKSKLNDLNPTGNNLGQFLFETHNQVLSDCEAQGMSTLSALFYNKTLNKAQYVNIGDSRIYQFSNQFIERITDDDSLSDRSNILTKCLGLASLSIDDFMPTDVVSEYNFLICTDGFYKLMLNDLKAYFQAYNFKNFRNIEKKLSLLQRRKNNDDSSYILIKNEISGRS